jgi:hypothetical protein
MIDAFLSLLLATKSPSKPSPLKPLEQQVPVEVATDKFCSKQTAKVFFKDKLIKTLPFPDPVCNNDRNVVEVLLKATQKGYLALPDEQNCAAIAIIVQPTAETQFFVAGIPFCLKNQSNETFKSEFIFYRLEIEPGAIYETP